MPRSLAEIGMPEDGIERAAELAVKNPYWNPRTIEQGGIRDLLRRAWWGARPQSS
jgi:maleylacetate reductase